MKYIKEMLIFFNITIIITSQSLSQIIPDMQAPEIWSKPKVIKSVPEDYYGSLLPSVTGDGNILTWDGTYYIERTDTGWSEVKLTNFPYINSARTSIISFDGNRSYYRIFSGGWDLYYSDWDRENGTWGDIINCGTGVNDPFDAETHGHQINDTTLIFLKTSLTYISYWNEEESTWGEATEWPGEYYGFSSSFGFALTQNLGQVYTVHFREVIDSNNQQLGHDDIFVTYKDTTNRRGYDRMYKLNICYESDSLFLQGIYQGNWEGYPAITADGKTLFFLANYDGKYRIYESYLLTDENGNPVSVKKQQTNNLSESFNLFPPYPNPFNSQLNISLKINIPGNGLFIIRDIVGREVKRINTNWLNRGDHSFKLSSDHLASGIYFITFLQNESLFTYKTMLLK